jgi:hypothetical protein
MRVFMEYIENTFKCAKKQSKTLYYAKQKAQGDKTHLPAESGPEREENKDKPNSNHLILAKALHRPTLEAQRSSTTKDGPVWAD